ncbi:MAG: toxin HipA [Alphaproteobacteria bacterium CG11_big_fil_rev_8_21_14_0_20_39_49]|nr:MAG: toxin HipA [Alphaproteobacteria bacterium CG11_big_fil_rev_8_21_14_0_20_39_49]
MTQDSNKKYLDVFLHNNYVGKLCSESGNLSFTYDASYLAKNDAVKLSSSLPLRAESFDNPVTSAYFSGLLPDEYVRIRLARYLGISEKNTFALLKEIGGECAGAVSVHKEGSAPDKNEKPQYRVLGDKEANDILSALDKRPMLAGEEDIRISGAGAQDKLVISFVNGQVAIPKRNTPSTHIIKPAIKDLEEPVQNEFFCMKLAKAIGFPVPEASIHRLDDRPYYLVKRYDRRIDKDGIVTRLHQEDFCQAMQIPPNEKYENEGGPTLERCFTLLDERIKSGAMAGKNKITLLQGVIFNFLIGNGDAHGKNFSLLYDGEAESLAPFYDLMCTAIYIDAYKAKMAMKIGGKYKFKEVSLRHFEQLGDAIGFKQDFIRKHINAISNDVSKAATKLCIDLNGNKNTQSNIYEKIAAVIAKHSNMISTYLS